jgi:hypothetical protein
MTDRPTETVTGQVDQFVMAGIKIKYRGQNEREMRTPLPSRQDRRIDVLRRLRISSHVWIGDRDRTTEVGKLPISGNGKWLAVKIHSLFVFELPINQKFLPPTV